MPDLWTLVGAFNSLTPLGLAAGLAVIIYQLTSKKGAIRTISENHLSGLPEMNATLLRMDETMKRQETTLLDIRDGINYLKGRSSGG